jgi:hypothetical protein
MEENTFWWRLVHLDPALLRGLIMAVIFALASLGIIVTPALPDSLITLVGAVFAIIQALWTKPAVVPNAKVVTYLEDPAQPRVISPGEAVTTASDSAIIAAARESGKE